MRRRTIRIGFNAGLAAIASVAALGCGSSPITAARIEAAMAGTFANLVHLQVNRLGLSPMAVSDFSANASCRKLIGPSIAGAGDWVCTVAWQGPDKQFLRDTYDLFVATDGCYTATVEGGALGGPNLYTPDGSDVKNLLFTFEGCFDTT